MLGNFSYCNPTKLYFGDESLDYLNTELPKYGKNVVLIYGGDSIKKNGIYDAVVKIREEIVNILRECLQDTGERIRQNDGKGECIMSQKVLVAYFSASGTTARVAQEMARETGQRVQYNHHIIMKTKSI